MYRLPTQFDASASRQDLAAAGGGSTSTTCSSCIVTLLGTSVLSAMVLGSLQPMAPAAAGSAVQATADTGIGTQPPGPLQEPAVAVDPDLTRTTAPAVPVAGLSRPSRVLLGLFALPLAAAGGGLFMSIGSPIFGLFVAVAVFVGLYAIVHERSGRSLGRGIGIGICLLLGLFAAGALEMVLWLSLMK
ncbi:hypothetical protein [Stenotrophomonas rhizophila]|uniref:hypothetical protein n=1 Tax=Stenotrophomonas rhizophila TaxID=216778 RepID=UPI001E5E362C|nr:hypothetical protein [Stenotrophomonas rhizophila]MCC7635835.1 hypothetical protein [Stenotrophomonas rhizophila]MCC7662659.1 hypothetical protein [Stenotrophomonas rhizophila]